MFWVLLTKDLCRARRNPVPYLIHLGVPLLITALLGMVFAGGNEGGPRMGRIKVAVVDEDRTPLATLFRGALNQGEASRYLELDFLARDEALRLLTENQLAAALIIPEGFSRGYLTGTGQVTWTVVKNPAQQVYPAIVEEALAAATTGLNAVARNFRPDLLAWRETFLGGSNVTVRSVGELLIQTGERFDRARRRLDPIPVSYEREARTNAAANSERAAGSGAPKFNLFAFLLPGLSAMFLLFLADVAMRDVQREMRFRTFARQCTLPTRLFEFVLSKVSFSFVILALSAAILLGGGAVVFGFAWRDPLLVVGLAAGYALFAGGLMASLAGLIRGERQADVLGSVVAMGFGLAGGCTFPAEALPTALRDHVTAHLPPHWFITAMRSAQSGEATGAGWWVAGQMAVLGLALAALSAWLLRRRLEQGGGR